MHWILTRSSLSILQVFSYLILFLIFKAQFIPSSYWQQSGFFPSQVSLRQWLSIYQLASERFLSRGKMSFPFDDSVTFKESPLSLLSSQVLFLFLNAVSVALSDLSRFLPLSFNLASISFRLSLEVAFAARSIVFIDECSSCFRRSLLLFTLILLLIFEILFSFLEVKIGFLKVFLIFSLQFLFIYLSFYWAVLPLHFRNLSTEFNLQFILIWLRAPIPCWKYPSAALKWFIETRALLSIQTEPKQMLPLVSLWSPQLLITLEQGPQIFIRFLLLSCRAFASVLPTFTGAAAFLGFKFEVDFAVEPDFEKVIVLSWTCRFWAGWETDRSRLVWYVKHQFTFCCFQFA